MKPKDRLVKTDDENGMMKFSRCKRIMELRCEPFGWNERSE
jgi:hypothetical protein